MKFLAVVGSPRKGGNTDLLVETLLEGARESGAQTEKVYLADLRIEPCDACEACRTAGDCLHDDDMIPLYDKLFDSDVWVLGSPVYWWGPSAQMKLFIDRWYRFSSEGERSQVRGKRGILVAPYGDKEPETPRHLVGMLEDSFAYLGMQFVGKVLVTANELGVVATNPAVLREALELGKRVAGGQQ